MKGNTKVIKMNGPTDAKPSISVTLKSDPIKALNQMDLQMKLNKNMKNNCFNRFHILMG